VIAAALAMVAAKSIDPKVYVKYLTKVTAASSGATVVNTYAQAVGALNAGQTIQYVGATGPMVFDAHNTANRPYATWTFDPSTKSWVIGQTLPASAQLP